VGSRDKEDFTPVCSDLLHGAEASLDSTRRMRAHRVLWRRYSQTGLCTIQASIQQRGGKLFGTGKNGSEIPVAPSLY